MIFYTATDDNGRLRIVGTQADARAIHKQFEQIDIPTDKAGLMATIQELYDEIHAPRVEQAPEAVSVPVPAPAPALPEGYTERAVRFEDEFDKMPLALQLHYAGLAVENARCRLPSIVPGSLSTEDNKHG